ncbi:hypothetical protein K7432_011333 [Basidiobolus ranarum]|uniref:Rhomboid-type serine protease n=1 Tax=Basidiobolus ranarum TaxID=34480 RepID=A0ABR2VU26_9FUNG
MAYYKKRNDDPDRIIPVEESSSSTILDTSSGQNLYNHTRSDEEYARQLYREDHQLQQTNYSQQRQMPPPQPGFLASADYPGQAGYYSSRPQQQQQQQQQYSQYPMQPPPPPQNAYTLPLLDPKQANIQKQMAKRRYWAPWFIRTVSLAQLVLVIYSLYRNSQLTGSWIQTKPYFNWLIGPAPETLINIGARFVPCMHSTKMLNQPIVCGNQGTCSLEELCGFGGFKGGEPNQWFRFITPIFLHGGVLHYLINMTYQLSSGSQMERDMGPFRMALLYMISGIGGFIFGGNFAPQNLPSVGASGALFGLIGCQLVDLIQHWSLYPNPCGELFKMIILLIINFAIGLLPSIDNFAHIGGFVCGVFTAFVLLPTVHTSNTDKWVKRLLMVVGLVVVVLLFWLGLKYFYSGEDPSSFCPWCKYFSCLPINNWCDAVY